MEVLFDVRNVFNELAYADDLDQPWVNSMMRLAARAVQGMEDKEILALDKLDASIRNAAEEDAA